MNHNPPTITRSYKSKELVRARKHFDLSSLLERLSPGEDEWDTLYSAAIAQTAYGTTRGAKSPFPAPIDFIDVHYGYGDEDEPVWEDTQTRGRSLLMVRIVSRLIERVKSIEINRIITVGCPVCEENSIEVNVGNPLIWSPKMWALRIDIDNERAVGLKIKCDCKGYKPFDFVLIERQL